MNQPVSSSLALPTLVTADDDGAAIRSLEFFTENIPDPRMRAGPMAAWRRWRPFRGVIGEPEAVVPLVPILPPVTAFGRRRIFR